MIAGSIALVRLARRRAALRAPARLAALARGGLPAQQPRARRAVLRRLLGHVLPADLRGGDGRRRRRSGRRGSTATSVPLALVLVLLSGIGPVIAWRRATRVEPAPQPAQARAGRRSSCCAVPAPALRASAAEPPALLMFVLGAFVLGAVGQELVARRARAAGDVRRRRARSRSSRSSAATAGATAATSCTSGIAVLFVGVAASSAFQDERDVAAAPGPERHVSAATTSPTSSRPRDLRAGANGRLEQIDLGARLRVSRDGERVGDAAHRASPSSPRGDPSLGPVSRFFEGEATSEVGLHAGLRRDVWTAIAPDIGALRPRIEEGDERLRRRRSLAARAARRVPRPRRSPAWPAPTRTNPPPATFRLIVSPLVTWIWIGALIVVPRRPDRAVAAPRGARAR